jgi:hypothetical protein
MFLETSIAKKMDGDASMRFTLVTRDRSDEDKLSRIGTGSVGWTPLMRPFRNRPVSRRAYLAWRLADVLAVLGFYLHLSLVYRFNLRHGFIGFRNKLRQSRQRRQISWKQGHPVRRWIGWPAPRSQTIFRLAYRLYYSGWQRHPQVRALFDRLEPEAVFLATVQSPFVTAYALEAAAREIPILGMIGSWDQPTTKGPICPGVSRVIAHSRYSASSTEAIQGLQTDSVEVIGWPQMDPYHVTAKGMQKGPFLGSIGLPQTNRLIVMGGYTKRLGPHEPAIADRLARFVKEGRFGGGCSLIIRPHPADSDWANRFGGLHDPPNVIIEEPDLGHLDHLAGLMKHADVVLSSAGTLCLDATALDTPSVGIAFSLDDTTPFFDRPERMFEMEHYASVAATGGIRLARGFDELVEIIETYLKEQGTDGEGRDALRDLHLEPLDGRSGDRLLAAIKRLVSDNARNIRG